MQTNGDFVTIKEFTKLIGVSRQTLSDLWRQGRGPLRYDTRRPAAPGQSRFVIPLEEGLRWHRERQAHMPAGHRDAGRRTREWWAARRRAKQQERGAPGQIADAVR